MSPLLIKNTFFRISFLWCIVAAWLFLFPSFANAVAGEGSATIDIQGEGSPGANQNVQISGNYDIVVVLTVGASGIAADGENIRITVPAGWTAPQSTTATAAGYVTVTSSAGTVAIGTITGQSVNINVTGALSSGNTVTLRYGNKTSGPGAAAPSTGTAAAEFIVLTDDTGANSLTEINGGTSPTVTVYGTVTLAAGPNTTSNAITLVSINNAIAQFSLTAAGEAMTLTDMVVDIVNNQGTEFPVNRLSNIRIVYDATAGDDFNISTDTTQCSSTKSSVTSFTNITFDCDSGGSNLSITAGQTRNFFVVVDTTASWVVGDSMRASFNTATDIVATGGTSGVATVNATASLPVQGNILLAYDAAKRDRTPPPLPTDLKAEVAHDLSQIKVTWVNPNSTDLYRVHLLRAVNSSSVSRTPFQIFPATIQEYIDTPVTSGNIYYYALETEDLAGNISAVSTVVNAKVEAPVVPEPIVQTEETPMAEEEPVVLLPFEDVPKNHKARVYIEAVYQEGIMGGETETQFAPNAKIKRAQAAAYISRLFKFDAKAIDKKPYKDVKVALPEAAAIKALKKINVLDKGNYFRPKKNITRGDFIVWLIKARLANTDAAISAETKAALEKAYESPYFTDLSLKNPKVKYILASRELGFYPGYKKNGKAVSAVLKPLRKAEAAMFIARAFF